MAPGRPPAADAPSVAEWRQHLRWPLFGFAVLVFYWWIGGLDGLFGWAIGGLVAGRSFGSLVSVIRVEDGVLHYRSLFGWRHTVDLRRLSGVVLPRPRFSWLEADRPLAVFDADGNVVNIQLLPWRDWRSLVAVVDHYATRCAARVDATTEAELAALANRPVRERPPLVEVRAEHPVSAEPPSEPGAALRARTTVPLPARGLLALLWIATLVVIFGPVSSRSPESYGVPWDAIGLVLGVLVMLMPMALFAGVRWTVQASVVVAGACLLFSLIDVHFAPDIVAIEVASFAVPLVASAAVYRRYRPVTG